MFIKLAGSLLIIISATVIGWYRARQYLLRVKHLKELHLAFSIFNTEISYRQTILPEALSKCSNSVEEPVASLFKNTAGDLNLKRGKKFEEIWQQYLNKSESFSGCLKKADIKILREWGQQIGKSELSEQKKINQLTLEKLDIARKNAENEAEKKVKLIRYTGLLFGLMIVILLY